MDEQKCEAVCNLSDWTVRYFWRITFTAISLLLGYLLFTLFSMFFSPHLYEVASRRFCLAIISTFFFGFLVGYFFDRQIRLTDKTVAVKPVRFLSKKGWTKRFIRSMLGSIFGWGLGVVVAVFITFTPIGKAIYENLLVAAIWSIFGPPVFALLFAQLGFLEVVEVNEKQKE
jgi:hypothetical protein